MDLAELKKKSPAELLAFAEELQIENIGSLRKQDMMFTILKTLAENDVPIFGSGVLEVLQDGFGFLRSPEENYLAGPDDIYVSPSQVRRFGLRTGDTVEGQIRSPKDGERYFALLKVNTINFEDPDAVRHRINFDNLTPLYPDRKFTLEIDDPTRFQVFQSFVDIAPQGVEFVAADFRLDLPVSQSFAHDLAGRRVITIGDGTLYEGRHFSRQGNGQSFDAGHGQTH